MAFFNFSKRLREQGVLGMNARNAQYIQAYNRREFYPRADSKLYMKQLAQQAGIPVPDLYAVVSSLGQFRETMEQLNAYSEFVIKPEHGSGGEGVLVLSRTGDGGLVDSAERPVSYEEIRMHFANILYGLYSLGGQLDRAMVEYKVRFSPEFKDIIYRGVPDVRLVVFLGVPVLAMMRLPTKKSAGRANLHQGAVGVGINMSSGVTRGGVWGSGPVEAHPDTGTSIQDLLLPHWPKMLEIACRSFDLFELGYLGVDIVLDEELGPLVLEVNVRPGLAVQLANRIGLRNRLRHIKAHIGELTTIEDKIRFAREEVARIGAP